MTVAQVAVMRKIVIIAHSLYKSEDIYNENYPGIKDDKDVDKKEQNRDKDKLVA